MSDSSQHNETPPARWGDLWHRLWPTRAAEPPEPTPAVTEEPMGHNTEALEPEWDNPPVASDLDTAKLTAAPTEPFRPAPPPDVPTSCPVCNGQLSADVTYCVDCGYVLASDSARTKTHVTQAPSWHERFVPRQPLPCRPGVQRWVAQARQLSNTPNVEIYYSLIRQKPAEPVVGETADEDTVNLQAPLDATPSQSGSMTLSPEAADWPGARWLHRFLTQLTHGVPAVIEYTEESAEEVLVLQPPPGKSLWDAWDDSAAPLARRFGWLRQIAELLQELHRHHVIVEALRPEMFVVTADDQVFLTDLSELLPMPVPAGVPMKGDLSMAPELVLAPELADGRSDLFPFGALVYALHHGRELTDLDFDAHGVPRPFVSVFPDGHPVLTQIVLKTFTRYVENRFPTAEDNTDSTGFAELIRHLEAGERSATSLRLEVAGWSSTGLTRTTNEDAFAAFHAAAFGEDRWGDQALVVLADGMGGCNAGEVASALAIQTIRNTLCAHPPYDALTVQNPSQPGDDAPEEITTGLQAAIEHANTTIHAAAEQGDGAHLGMGCTCEAAYLFRGRLYLGHVGDSRTYLYRLGQIRQLTQDQTMVNRMVTMGVLTADEALQHPRRHELDQALGGSHPVEIQSVTEELQPGDVLVFCSDGLTNHVADRSISEVLRNTHSAETAARRLVNLANALGGSDNVTAVVVRVT